MLWTLHTWVEDGTFRSERAFWCPEHDVWFCLPSERSVLDFHVELFHS